MEVLIKQYEMYQCDEYQILAYSKYLCSLTCLT